LPLILPSPIYVNDLKKYSTDPTHIRPVACVTTVYEELEISLPRTGAEDAHKPLPQLHGLRLRSEPYLKWSIPSQRELFSRRHRQGTGPLIHFQVPLSSNLKRKLRSKQLLEVSGLGYW
jgi:hypothetical protein